MDRNLTNRSGILPPIVKRGIAAAIDLFICVLVIQLPLEIIIRLSGPSFFENLESAWPVTLYRSSSILLFCLRDLTGGVRRLGDKLAGTKVIEK